MNLLVIFDLTFGIQDIRLCVNWWDLRRATVGNAFGHSLHLCFSAAIDAGPGLGFDLTVIRKYMIIYRY